MSFLNVLTSPTQAQRREEYYEKTGIMQVYLFFHKGVAVWLVKRIISKVQIYRHFVFMVMSELYVDLSVLQVNAKFVLK